MKELRLRSSKYGDETSARDSEPSVATEVRASCLLCASGTCLPVRYGESKSESVEPSCQYVMAGIEVSGETYGGRNSSSCARQNEMPFPIRTYAKKQRLTICSL